MPGFLYKILDKNNYILYNLFTVAFCKTNPYKIFFGTSLYKNRPFVWADGRLFSVYAVGVVVNKYTNSPAKAAVNKAQSHAALALLPRGKTLRVII